MSFPAFEKDRFEQLTGILKALIPGSFLIALLFYLGFSTTSRLYWEFGLRPEILELSPTDYIYRSTYVVMRSLLCAFISLFAAVYLHQWISRWYHKGKNRTPKWVFAWFIFLSGILGFLVFTPVAFDLFEIPGISPFISPLLASCGFVVSLILIKYGCYRRGQIRTGGPFAWNPDDPGGWIPAMYRLSFWGLLGVGLFILADSYAKHLGRQDAELLSKNASLLPTITIYSEKKLGLLEHGVQLHELENASPGYRYCYSGLKVLIRASNRYFVFPESQSPYGGIILIPEESGVRFEFVRGTANPNPKDCT